MSCLMCVDLDVSKFSLFNVKSETSASDPGAVWSAAGSPLDRPARPRRDGNNLHTKQNVIKLTGCSRRAERSSHLKGSRRGSESKTRGNGSLSRTASH